MIINSYQNKYHLTQ